jgi:hypothetical protein
MTAKGMAMAAWLLLAGAPVRADADIVPGGPFDASRYQALSDKSPFAVATPVAVESVEFALVGVAQFDGVSYASIINKQSSDHFVVTSATPTHGMSLVSLVRGQNADSTYATLQKGGEMLKLKLETAGVSGSMPTATPGVPVFQPAPMVQSVYVPSFHRRPPHPRMFSTPIFVPRPPPNSP